MNDVNNEGGSYSITVRERWKSISVSVRNAQNWDNTFLKPFFFLQMSWRECFHVHDDIVDGTFVNWDTSPSYIVREIVLSF